MCKSPSNNLPSDMCRIIGTFLNGDGDTCRRRRRCQATLRHQQRNINIARAAQTKLHAPLSVHCIGILQEIGEFNFPLPLSAVHVRKRRGRTPSESEKCIRSEWHSEKQHATRRREMFWCVHVGSDKRTRVIVELRVDEFVPEFVYSPHLICLWRSRCSAVNKVEYTILCCLHYRVPPVASTLPTFHIRTHAPALTFNVTRRLSPLFRAIVVDWILRIYFVFLYSARP